MEKKEIKEDFCPSCLIVPLAFAGTGATVAGEVIPGKHKKMKKGLLISGILTIVFTVGLVIYYLKNKDKCDSCKI